MIIHPISSHTHGSIRILTESSLKFPTGSQRRTCLQPKHPSFLFVLSGDYPQSLAASVLLITDPGDTAAMGPEGDTEPAVGELGHRDDVLG